MARLKTIEWIHDTIRIIDQTKLPARLVYSDIDTIEQMYHAIKKLQVRGAPAIGVAAAFGLYIGVRDFSDAGSITGFISHVKKQAAYLAGARPTAVNLFWALNRMSNTVSGCTQRFSILECKEILLKEAKLIFEEDIAAGKAIGKNGFELLKNVTTILTHCNAGGLATAEYGTALAPIYVGKEQGKIFHVYADETRPLLQGSRLTAFELQQAGIPVTIICDNMAASVMAKGKIEAVIVGADRIAANGDTANKIGTYSVALAAKAHKIPFFVAAPLSTFDLTIRSGKQIPIEERDANEVIFGFGTQTGPEGVDVYNPAFDVTPGRLITAIITERGVLYPPFGKSIKAMTS
jgi:methylthioribose-1-phosphate isomerase